MSKLRTCDICLCTIVTGSDYYRLNKIVHIPHGESMILKVVNSGDVCQDCINQVKKK